MREKIPVKNLFVTYQTLAYGNCYSKQGWPYLGDALSM